MKFKDMSKTEMTKWFAKRSDDHDLEFTTNPDEAIYMFPNGLMLDGEFYYGSRCKDHRCIEQITKHNRYDMGEFWQEVHYDLGLIRIVPESETVMIGGHQNLSKKQQDFIKNSNFEVKPYIE